MSKAVSNRHVLILAGALALLGCGGVGAAEDDTAAAAVSGEVTPRFHFSTDTEEQILRLYVEGFGEVAPSYRLFGDGRLVREILFMGNHKPVHSAGQFLSYDDMVALFELVVAGDLPEMTPDGLRVKNGGRALPGAKDGAEVVLELNLLNYRTKNGFEVSPFAATVSMLSPHYVAERLPELREAQAIVALLETLDGYFTASADDVVRTELGDKSFTQGQDDDP